MPVPPQYVSEGSDGSVYFGFGGSGTGSELYRLSGASLIQTQPAAPPPGYSNGSGVFGIAPTSHGVFWFSAYQGSSYYPAIGVECGGSGGTATLCEPSIDEPTALVLDASARLWIGGWLYSGGGEIVTSNGSAGSFSAGIVQLINGPNGTVWGALQYPNYYSIDKLAVAGSNVQIVQEYQLPAGASVGSFTLGGDGAFWFVDNQHDAIGRMTTTGSVREFPLTTPNALGQSWYGLWQIATACDGAVWFSEPQANKIGRIDGSGTINEFAVAAGSLPNAVTARPPAGRGCVAPEVWVGEQQAGKLAAISF